MRHRKFHSVVSAAQEAVSSDSAPMARAMRSSGRGAHACQIRSLWPCADPSGSLGLASRPSPQTVSERWLPSRWHPTLRMWARRRKLKPPQTPSVRQTRASGRRKKTLCATRKVGHTQTLTHTHTHTHTHSHTHTHTYTYTHTETLSGLTAPFVRKRT